MLRIAHPDRRRLRAAHHGGEIQHRRIIRRGHAHPHPHSHVVSVIERGGCGRIERLVMDETDRPAVGEDVGHLLGIEQKVERHQRAAGLEGTEIGDHELGTVAAEQAQPVALPDPGCGERTGHPVRGPIERGVAPITLIGADADRLAESCRRRPKTCGDVGRDARTHHRGGRQITFEKPIGPVLVAR